MARIGGNPGNKGGGRKTKGQETNIVRYYEDLLPKVFIKVRDLLDKGNKADKKWAMEYLKTGFVKLIPQVQKIGGDENNPIPILTTNVYTNDSHQANTGNEQADKGSAGGNKCKQDNLNTAGVDRPSPEGQDTHTDQHNVGVLSALEAGSNEGLQTNNEGPQVLEG